MAIFELIEDFYSRERRHAHLGYLSPAEYQTRWHEQQAQARVISPKPSTITWSPPSLLLTSASR